MNINTVLTTKEASLKYDISDKTLRKWLADEIFPKDSYRKSGDVWIVEESSLIKKLMERHMFKRRFIIDGESVSVEKLMGISCDSGIEIWAETDFIYRKLEAMDISFINIKILDFIYRNKDKYDIKYVLIDDNFNESLNAYFKKEKVLLVTFKEVCNFMKNK